MAVCNGPFVSLCRASVFFFALGIAACHPNLQESETKLVDGQVIEDDLAKAVVQIAGQRRTVNGIVQNNCTATWIGTNTLITAAHCVGEKASRSITPNIFVQSGLGSEYGLEISTEVFVYEPYYTGSAENDVALIVFSSDIVESENTASLYTDEQPLEPGQIIHLFGYGGLDEKASHAGSRRWGCNSIHDVDEHWIKFVGPTSTQFTPQEGTDELGGDGRNVTLSQGDSGGPMFLVPELSSCDGDKAQIENVKHLVGINSVVASGAQIESWDTNLQNPGIRDWLAGLTKTGGAKINGINTARSADARASADAGQRLPRQPKTSAPPKRGAEDLGSALGRGVPESRGSLGSSQAAGSCSCSKSNGQCVVAKGGTVLGIVNPPPAWDANCAIICKEGAGSLWKLCGG